MSQSSFEPVWPVLRLCACATLKVADILRAHGVSWKTTTRLCTCGGPPITFPIDQYLTCVKSFSTWLGNSKALRKDQCDHATRSSLPMPSPIIDLFRNTWPRELTWRPFPLRETRRSRRKFTFLFAGSNHEEILTSNLNSSEYECAGRGAPADLDPHSITLYGGGQCDKIPLYRQDKAT